MKWDNLTENQKELLSATEKIAKMEGVFTGWYYAALMVNNKDAARVAFDLKRDASVVLNQVCTLGTKLNEQDIENA